MRAKQWCTVASWRARQQVPLLRALRVATTEPATGVFTVLRTAERESQYQWVGPLMDVETALYSANTQQPVRCLQDASTQGRIAVPRKWLAYDYLRRRTVAEVGPSTAGGKRRHCYRMQSQRFFHV